MNSRQPNGVTLQTRILLVKMGDLGHFKEPESLEHWELPTDPSSLAPLRLAAERLKMSNIPVGFPTETVYGLGADATRSEAVKGIYNAKNRPSDNPLISHVSDLSMLRSLLSPAQTDCIVNGSEDPIPEIYKPLIQKFWPGPLTILLPNPTPSKLAPEVTAGLPSFGVRMPDSPLALSLIHLAGVPLAAPSANASTKPSPTTAQHVKHDLDGRIEIILDGGACHVGVESTVVDGLCFPPVVLRPGGVSIDCIRQCKGWEGVVKGYKDAKEVGEKAPRAPGMKYKHYSPKATVVLYEASCNWNEKAGVPWEVWRILDFRQRKASPLDGTLLERPLKIGIIRTKSWQDWAGWDGASNRQRNCSLIEATDGEALRIDDSFETRQGELHCENLLFPSQPSRLYLADLVEISLGQETKDIAHGLFSALRALDSRSVDVIYVEGIEDEGDIAAAVMNRLRKAATHIHR